MALIEEFENSGNFLFKYRTWLPVFLFPVFAVFFYFDSPGTTILEFKFLTIIAALISFVGLLIRWITIGTVPRGTSGKNTKRQVAESLNTSGIYSTLRHPLYLGNFLIWLGIAVYTAHIYLILFIILFFWIYYERIMFAEESFLRKKYGEQYLEWSLNTPAFIPRFKNYRKSELSFSSKNVIKRESHALVNTIFSFALVDLIHSYFQYKTWSNGVLWAYILITSILFFGVLRLIIKKTDWLKVEGR